MKYKVIVKEGRHSFIKYCGSHMLDAHLIYQNYVSYCAARMCQIDENINATVSIIVDGKLYKSTSITSKTKAV